jgi:hypothetical protein
MGNRGQPNHVIIWLASYPRSGNTLLRMILKRCFGLDSYSIYGDEEFADPAVQRIVGEKPVGPDPQAFLQQMLQERRLVCVKTHQLPTADSHRAIYVVRDGRAAVVSHYHYLRDLWDTRLTLEDVIKGLDHGSWSQHVNAWLFSGRSNVLTLRYEDIIRGDKAAQVAIAAFIGRPPPSAFDVRFSELHDMMPVFFRAGSNESNIAEMTPEQLALFERLHGGTLRALGYPAQRPGADRMPDTSLSAISG